MHDDVSRKNDERIHGRSSFSLFAYYFSYVNDDDDDDDESEKKYREFISSFFLFHTIHDQLLLSSIAN